MFFHSSKTIKVLKIKLYLINILVLSQQRRGIVHSEQSHSIPHIIGDTDMMICGCSHNTNNKLIVILGPLLHNENKFPFKN